MTNSSSQQPLRLALVGAGGLGRAWAQMIAAQQGARFVGIVDPLIGTDKASTWLADHAEVAQYNGMDKLVAAGVDAIVVTAFSTAHFEIIDRAIDDGLHVLVEKPFTTTMADAEKLVEKAAARGVTLMVSQNYRFFPGARMVRDIVADKRYGNVVAVAGQFWCDWPGKPYQHGMQHVMGLEMAVHHFDLSRSMFWAEPVGGCVREWQPADSQYAQGGAIEGLFDMQGPSGVFPFTYSGSLVGRAPRTPWPGLWRIEFDKETLVVDTVEGRYGLYRAHADGFEWLGRFDGDDMMFGVPLDHFVQCVRDGKEPWTSARDNLGTLKMALGAEIFGDKS